jgi:4-aminobutyrate aminotransferase
MTTDTAATGAALLDERADDSSVWLARRAGIPAVWARYTDLVVDRGEGSWIVTQDGDRYLDHTCGIGVTNTGHAHPRVSAAIAEQAAKIIHAQQNILYHKPGLELHERLPRYFPNASSDDEIGLFLSNSGAEAIEAAVKLAKIATHRPAIVASAAGSTGEPRHDVAHQLPSRTVATTPLLASTYFAPYLYPLRTPTERMDEAALA